MNSEFPILYIMHGGGPMPLLLEKEQLSLQNFLKEVSKTIPVPKAILVISAHWEEDITTILSKEKPDLLFDYYGFPSETYNYKYPTRNDLNIVKKISELLKRNNIPFKLDDKRDYDHGVFVPLLLMYPKADIPVLQISLNSSLDPKIHIKIGEAISELRNEEILILGSGSSFHGFFERKCSYNELIKHSEIFDEFLNDVCTNKKYSKDERYEKLNQWEKAKSAKFSHPREEHLIPLMVCVGASKGESGIKIYDDYYMNFKASAYKF